MDSLPETKSLRQMHPEDLTTSTEKLFMFMSGWLGGPQLFVEKFGHPRLRARHLPFKIGVSERDQWLLCFAKALEDLNPVEPLKSDLFRSIARLADHMRNQEEKPVSE
jgi:hemoglobin